MGWYSATGWSNTGWNSPAVSAGLLLDSLSVSALAAYSTRKLRTAYAGSALRVLRSSDSTTLDIGFSGNDLDTTALTTFVGGGSGTVTIWYDQSVNAHNAIITGDAGVTGGPTIVNAGTAQTLNTHTSIFYPGGTGIALMPQIGITAQPLTFAIMTKLATVVSSHHWTDAATNRPIIGASGAAYQLYNGGTPRTGGTLDTSAHALIGIFNDASTASELLVDGSAVIVPTTVGTSGTDTYLYVGAGSSTPVISINGDLPEFICFSSALGSTDQSKIRTSWQSYWGAP